MGENVNVSKNLFSDIPSSLDCPAGPFDYGGACCSSIKGPCGEGQGSCNGHDECKGDLYCGIDNCRFYDPNYPTGSVCNSSLTLNNSFLNFFFEKLAFTCSTQ